MMYVCSTHRTRGDSACPVKQGLRVGTIDQSIVLHLREILTPELLEKILHDWIMGCRDADRLKERATALQADLATLDSELMTGRFPRPIRCRRTADRPRCDQGA